jgi:hypothetical protein
MARLVIAFLLVICAIMAVLLFLIIVLSAALLIFFRGVKKVKQKVNPLTEPEKRTI